jgi:hypothetical protein
MADWIPMFAMPNVKVQDPIEVDGIAIASPFDKRIVELTEKHARFGVFIKRFKTEFSRELNPSFIMVRDDAPMLYRRVDALSSFRDALAISVTTRTWSKVFEFGRGGNYGPQYSDAFRFYPWMLDKDYHGITTRSMAMLSYEDEVNKLNGQSFVGVPVIWLISEMVDQTLLDALLKRWQRRYSGRSPSWKDRALFRSLNMANAAAMLPGHAEITNYDIGRHTALWVSAFEILAHPKKSDTGFQQVYDLLEKAPWGSSHHKGPTYSAYQSRTKRSQRILPCWVYGELYRARNDFLHGNPIRPARLTTPRSKRGLFFYAWPLYRMALTSFLGLKWKGKAPPAKNPAERLKYEDVKFDFESYQRQVESGLSSIKFTDKEADDIRNGRLSPTVVRRPY